MRKILTSISMCFLALVVGFSFAACKKKPAPKLEGTYKFSQAGLLGFTGNNASISEWLESFGNQESMVMDSKDLKQIFDYIINMEVTLNADGTAKFVIKGVVGSASSFIQYGDYEKLLNHFKAVGIVVGEDLVLNTSYTNTNGTISFGKVFIGKIDDLKTATNDNWQIDQIINYGDLDENGMMTIEGAIGYLASVRGYYNNCSFTYYSYDENGAVELTEDEMRELEEKYGVRNLQRYSGSSSYWNGTNSVSYDYIYYSGTQYYKTGPKLSALTGNFANGKLTLNTTVELYTDGCASYYESETFGYETQYIYLHSALIGSLPIKITLEK